MGTHSWNFKSWCDENQTYSVFCSFSLYHTIQKEKQGAWQNYVHIGAHDVMQTLYWEKISHWGMWKSNPRFRVFAWPVPWALSYWSFLIFWNIHKSVIKELCTGSFHFVTQLCKPEVDCQAYLILMTEVNKFKSLLPSVSEEVGKARFNVATPTYATITCTRHVQHTYYPI